MKRCVLRSFLYSAAIAASCVIFLAYWDQRTMTKRRTDEKLDELLSETFPASDPAPYY
ncbi:MAG TPA: hypothetical protein VN633_20355 [Bryobacteraceae bacterium]|nr:hypothetical protein [Bryobacteraceae bacterium]